MCIRDRFPKLFGGGEAKLTMTGEEILDAGVQVMAQPPGKRNSPIHLLSGGEKALTATALVFALFKLNPAPFCLLDEVDAPLDDANTERYANLVANMSEQTQFLFISHNKIAMQMAKQLIDVYKRQVWMNTGLDGFGSISLRRREICTSRLRSKASYSRPRASSMSLSRDSGIFGWRANTCLLYTSRCV